VREEKIRRHKQNKPGTLLEITKMRRCTIPEVEESRFVLLVGEHTCDIRAGRKGTFVTSLGVVQ
jgi:hypothetical protein